MDVFLGEWVNLLLRWFHMIVGIGWIGTSFYFMALDFGLDTRERKSPGVYGTAWQVHGGGFYHVEKFTVAPPQLPAHLHWFKWDAYLTWMTGFGLLIVQYYLHARSYLIDPSVMSPHYPFLSAHPQSWLVVALIIVSGALIRHYINRVDAGDEWTKFGWAAPVAILAILGAIWLTAPRAPAAGGSAVSDAEMLALT